MRFSKLFTFNLRDIAKGFFSAILGALAGYIIAAINNNSLNFDWPAIGKGVLIAGLSYLVKNFLTNSKDEILTKEPGK